MIPHWRPCTRTPTEHSACLPPGRYLSTANEVFQTFVDPFATVSLTRGSIFTQWRDRTLEINQLTPAYEEWLGGSFTSDKRDPGDIDVVTVISSAVFNAMPPGDRIQLNSWNNAKIGNVHSFVVVEEFRTDPRLHVNTDFDRGYWDRLWSRHRGGGQTGYLMLERRQP